VNPVNSWGKKDESLLGTPPDALAWTRRIADTSAAKNTGVELVEKTRDANNTTAGRPRSKSTFDGDSFDVLLLERI
jgi:hypothetical protein